MKKYLLLFLTTLFLNIDALLAQEETPKVETDFSLELNGEYRSFFEEGAYPGQKSQFPAFAIQPEFSMEWDDGKQLLNFIGFGRWDLQDDNRTHWDIRELYWQYVAKNWELSIGAKKVFWGVTESVHLVDIINQTDVVESFDGEQKLGQPMVHFSYLTGFGTLDFFAMPYFRKLQFPGEAGRFRFPLAIDRAMIGFENEDMEEWHPSFATRWSNYIGAFDFGLSYFYGVGREPFFQADPESGALEFFYPINHQIGVDVQAITGPVLWKLEAMNRINDFQNFLAFAAGLEYTISNIRGSGIDLGVIGEFLFDERNEQAFNGMDNDLFFGGRLAFNDVKSTEILFGGIFDITKSTKLFSVEASRRIGSSVKIELEARIFATISEREFFSFFQNDSFARMSISKYF